MIDVKAKLVEKLTALEALAKQYGELDNEVTTLLRLLPESPEPEVRARLEECLQARESSAVSLAIGHLIPLILRNAIAPETFAKEPTR